MIRQADVDVPCFDYEDDEGDIQIYDSVDGDLAEVLVDSGRIDEGDEDGADGPNVDEDADGDEDARVELEKDREPFAQEQNNELHRRATEAALSVEAAAFAAGAPDVEIRGAGERAFIDELVRAAEEEKIADEETTARLLRTPQDGRAEFTAADLRAVAELEAVAWNDVAWKGTAGGCLMDFAFGCATRRRKECGVFSSKTITCRRSAVSRKSTKSRTILWRWLCACLHCLRARRPPSV
jgi:hypothetical protein